MNDLGRKFIRTAEACFAATSGMIVLVCTVDTIRGDQDTLINKIWVVAAVLAIAAVALEMVHQHYDDRDFEELEQKPLPRTLSDENRLLLKNRLTKYTGHKFEIRVAWDNAEGRVFAKDLASAFENCGWVGKIQDCPELDQSPGVTVCFPIAFIGAHPPQPYEDVANAIGACGLFMSQITTPNPAYPIPDPREMIVIGVGTKPAPGPPPTHFHIA